MHAQLGAWRGRAHLGLLGTCGAVYLIGERRLEAECCLPICRNEYVLQMRCGRS